jgi:hypothetical protein
MRLIQKGNSKLHNQYMWNMITNVETCGRECPGCYSLREQKRFPSIVASRTVRYEASLHSDFAEHVIKEIKAIKKPFTAFRIHASSEFYSQIYIDKWLTIAQALPHIRFYAFTKRLRDFDFSKLMSLPNVIIIDSLKGNRINYGTNPPASMYTCPVSKTIRCGIECSWCFSKCAQHFGVYFKKH